MAFLVKSGDLIEITVADAIIDELAEPVELTGTSEDLAIEDMPACLLGDQTPEICLAPLEYTAPPFVDTPGLGTLEVIAVPGENTTASTLAGEPVLVDGAPFEVVFTVEVPAIMITESVPPVEVPDPLLVKPGTASVITTNTTVCGS